MMAAEEARALLGLCQSQDLLKSGLRCSAEAMAMLASQGQQSDGAQTLLGAACMAGGEFRRALHFMAQAQQAEELESSWGGASSSSSSMSDAALPAAAAAAGAAVVACPSTLQQRAPLSVSSALLARMAECHEQLGEQGDAVAVLERIPRGERTAHIWARLGSLYAQQGMRPSTVAAYEACLRLCPHAVEAALALAELRVQPEGIKQLVSGMAQPDALVQLALQYPQLQQLCTASGTAPAKPEAAAAPAAGVGKRAAPLAGDSCPEQTQHTQQAVQQLAEAGAAAAVAQLPSSTVANGSPRACHQQQAVLQAAQQAQHQPGPVAAAAPGSGGRWRQHAPAAKPRNLLRGESACEQELVPQAAAAAAAPSAGDAGGALLASPCGSPVAVAAAAFFPGSGQSTPATSSPLLQQPAAPGQRRTSWDEDRPGNEEQEGQQEQQQPAAKRMLRLRSPAAPAPAASQQRDAAAAAAAGPSGPTPAAAGIDGEAGPAVSDARLQQLPAAHAPADAQLQAQQAQRAQRAQAGAQPTAAVPSQALIEAAQHILAFTCDLIDLQAALAAEDGRAARPLAQRLVQQAPRHPLVLVLAALCQADHGSAASALALFARAREQDPYSLLGAARHACLLRQAGDSVALATLAFQVSTDAGQLSATACRGAAEPWLVAAAAKELNGDLSEAVMLARKAVEREPGSAEAHLQLGWLLHSAHSSAGGPGTAGLAQFNAALKLRPSLRAYQGAVAAALTGALLTEAQRLAREAHSAFPQCQTRSLLLARVYACLPHSHGQAEALLRQTLREDPRCEQAALALAALLQRGARPGEAAAVLEGMLSASPSEALHVAAGQLALEEEQLEEAVSHLNAAYGFNPHSVAAGQGLQRVEAALAPAKEEGSSEGLAGGLGVDGMAREDEVVGEQLEGYGEDESEEEGEDEDEDAGGAYF